MACAWETQLSVLRRILPFPNVCTCWSHLPRTSKASVGCSIHVPNVPGPGRNAFLKEPHTQHSVSDLFQSSVYSRPSVQIRTYAHPLNVALVSVRSSRSSSPASSAPGNKEFLSAQSTQLQARDFPLLSSRAQEKHHLPISQVLHLRMNLIGDYLQRVC